ncbi:hypothetical protein H632_c3190p0 [Helicosporidium sp. ATCC 50920]|nr:hypothetical protein H632_c3190p0 [Helicosporidium sp. ATCC 50920]|eukprot:KDD72561.1 hypothetical protein H632_c3190p0 [Helicosporidium sp. ATCC 50920]
MSTSTVTVVDDLGAVYTEDVADVKKRFKMINDAFVARYGCKPRFYARSPGRVNLIGEHIDYSGYAVLPMALDLDTVVAIGPGENGLEVANVQSDKYPDHTLSVDPSVVRQTLHGAC